MVVGTYRKIRQSRAYRKIIGKIQDETFGEGVQLAITLPEKRGRKKKVPRVLIPEFVGDVRNLEVTYGSNGWHPHLHILLVAHCSEEQMATFAEEIFSLWKAKIAKQGYGKCSEKAFQYKPVSDPEGVAEYVAKWDIYREMTDASSKKAKGKGRNPAQILADIWRGLASSETDTALFREFAKAFRGCSKAHFQWRLEGEIPGSG